MEPSNQSYHILNGDSLLERFPSAIPGSRIVMRECLVDGPVEGETLETFYKNRAEFISTYEGCTSEDYFNTSIPEIKKIDVIPIGQEIYLWFEDDLFCQVNFWFVLHLLQEKIDSVFLVRPKAHNRYGFAALTTEELLSCLDEAMALQPYKDIIQLWTHYQNNNLKSLQAISNKYPDLFFISEAVQAHLDRQPNTNHMGKPKETILAILAELDTPSFGTVFQEFSRRLPNYGFGDLQVKRLYDELVNTKD